MNTRNIQGLVITITKLILKKKLISASESSPSTIPSIFIHINSGHTLRCSN